MSCGSFFSVQFFAELIIEFSQDTNTMQYELMRYIAAAHRCITVVGDPDQSSAISVIHFDGSLDIFG
jgi:superfamily I DNA/RNA helicase